MKKFQLPDNLQHSYNLLKKRIKNRLKELIATNERDIFYELCFCLCTSQSKAKNAVIVEKELRERNFFERTFNPIDILRNSNHYIRFHQQKSKNLLLAKDNFNKIIEILQLDISALEKRLLLAKNVRGLGMKESSHFLRNIGYRGLAILDRHILKHLVLCGIYKEIPKITSISKYIEIETTFQKFSKKVNISIDELDLLFWSYETGEILK